MKYVPNIYKFETYLTYIPTFKLYLNKTYLEREKNFKLILCVLIYTILYVIYHEIHISSDFSVLRGRKIFYDVTRRIYRSSCKLLKLPQIIEIFYKTYSK